MSSPEYSSSTIREKYEEVFDQAYAHLNPGQKLAVDNIEGPVLVNAGPGTGKTQILAVRIGKILREQDVSPHNILCLTFTDSATISMRNRLVKIIGPVAHRVHIFTFHAFCNQIIQENLEIFGEFKQLEPVSELETVDIYYEIIDDIPDDNILKRFKSDRYFEYYRLKHLFDHMKKEDLSVEDVLQATDEFIEEKRSDDSFIAKRKTNASNGVTYLKGDFRDDKFAEFVAGFDALKEAAQLFPRFNALMKKKERYDYNDMILWVLDAFKKNPDLLARYQERYLYFLVDEYQDTNGAQNHLLDLLISFWDKPNVFVVGDDDQAIYKFQGANLNNILDFKKKYQPLTIVLEENYRSNQRILDTARSLIEFNEERLVREDPELTKELKASGDHKDDPNPPQIVEFGKISEEYGWLVRQLKELNDTDPEALSDTAVIYRNHKQVDDIVTVLEKLSIPINIRKKVNILQLPLIKNIINILRYISEEYHSFNKGHHRIFEILHYPYWEIIPVDIGKLAMLCQKPDEDGNYPIWREVLISEPDLNKLNLRDPGALKKASSLLEQWIADVSELTLQGLFEKIINEGGILSYVMNQSNKAWLLQLVSTLFDFIKNETAKNPDMSLKDLLGMIDKMNENNLALEVNKVITSEKGVHFVTAHSAKGLEFRQVFMIGCTRNIWDEKRRGRGRYKYPDNINMDNSLGEEDERRLFFVGMTRAMTGLYISYSQAREDGKDLGASMFVDELKGSAGIEVERPELHEEELVAFYYNLLLKKERKIELIEHDLLDRWLESYQMSVTHLNKYLKCPLSFYFESVLRIPHARNAATGFGSAIHDTLKKYFIHYKKTGQGTEDKLLELYRNCIQNYRSHFTDDEFQSYSIHGEMTLKALLAEKRDLWFRAGDFAVEEKISNAEYNGVPIKGFLDKVEIYKDKVHVIDYKTGNFKNSTAKLRPPDEKNPNGGDYWRQLVFYKILLDSDQKNKWNMQQGEIEYVEADRSTGNFKTHQAHITREDIETVGEQITSVYEKIKNHEFDQTCGEEDCVWCNFIKDNYKFDPELIPVEYPEE